MNFSQTERLRAASFGSSKDGFHLACFIVRPNRLVVTINELITNHQQIVTPDIMFALDRICDKLVQLAARYKTPINLARGQFIAVGAEGKDLVDTLKTLARIRHFNDYQLLYDLLRAIGTYQSEYDFVLISDKSTFHWEFELRCYNFTGELLGENVIPVYIEAKRVALTNYGNIWVGKDEQEVV